MTTSTDDPGRAALAELPREGSIGLGSGTTIGWFLDTRDEAIRAGPPAGAAERNEELSCKLE